MSSMPPLVAIIGRANVGKSTLFNRLVRKRSAIVNDTPGVTRDRIYGRSEWLGCSFMVVDTGGVDVDGVDEIEHQVVEQAHLAQEEADAIIFVADKNQGVTPQDREVIGRVRKSGKPFFLAVNKVDHRKHEQELFEFAGMGVENIYPISAEHGDGVADLLDDLVSDLPTADVPEALGSTIRVAVVGRPNVGKSSLINKLLRSTRCIVSDIPGTTRDAIDTSLEFNGKNFLLVDTAGIRRKGRTKQVLDKFSVIMALKALDRCDIAVILVDGSEGITDQDATIAGYAYERGRGCVIAVNKWDLTKAREITIEDIERQVKDKFKFLDFAPVMVLSVKTGRGVDKLLPRVELICAEYVRNIPTVRLNECLERAVAKNPISSYRGKFVKMFYSVQIKNRPPTFKCFINYPQGIHFSYERYLINSLREMFGFSGTPVRLVFSGKSDRA